MEAYTDFARVYDIFMEDTPYKEWASYIVGILRRYGVSQGEISVLQAEGGLRNGEALPDGETLPSEEALPNGEVLPEGEILPGEEALPNGEDLPNGKCLPEAELVRLKALAAERNVVVDLGCGTGSLTELLADEGYDMIGVDSSQEMLNIAQEKKEKSGKEILYLLQDMRELELYGTAGAVVSVCDSLNYLLEEEELVRTFRLVNNYLYPGGVFIFDFNTVFKYETVIGDSTIAENREDCSFIWENYYDAEGQINEYDLTIFVRVKDGLPEEEGNGEGMFRRFTETHYQRGYTLEQMRGMVEKAGMKFEKAIDADTHGEVREESERIYVIAREFGKGMEKEWEKLGIIS